MKISSEMGIKMEKEVYGMLYLAACGIAGEIPDKAYCEQLEVSVLYKNSRKHFLTALIGTTLKKADLPILPEWEQAVFKAVRKNVLFDMEREKLFAFMESRGIWYLPLKGIVLKDYYPAVGMRQMSDNDILFDYGFCGEVQGYMESQGYTTVSVGKGNHDVYEKLPVYNFELHSALYGEQHPEHWDLYYKNIKERLLLTEGTSYGYHFTDEDFYVYLMSHAYKHYAGSGTGVRTLLDFYVYLKAKPELDFQYIEKECEVLGIAEFEKQNRSLCKKVFDVGSFADALTGEITGMAALEQSLSGVEREMLYYYLTSGVYGTVERGVENKMKKFQKQSGSASKVRYLLSRLIPDGKFMEQNYPFFYRYKILLPVAYVLRLLRVLLDKKRRGNMVREIKIVKKCNGREKLKS